MQDQQLEEQRPDLTPLATNLGRGPINFRPRQWLYVLHDEDGEPWHERYVLQVNKVSGNLEDPSGSRLQMAMSTASYWAISATLLAAAQAAAACPVHWEVRRASLFTAGADAARVADPAIHG